MITDEQRADARARYRQQFAALPPWSPERARAVAALFASIRLRIARDQARKVCSPNHLGNGTNGSRGRA